MPKSAWKWNRTENRTQNAKTGFQKIGSPLERRLPCSSGPLGLQKYWLPSIPARAWTRPLERTACLHSSPLERQIPPLEREPCLQKDAGSSFSPLERKQKFWKFQIVFLSFNLISQLPFLHARAQISNIIIQTWFPCKIITLWSSISWFLYMHVTKPPKPIINMLNFNQ